MLFDIIYFIINFLTGKNKTFLGLTAALIPNLNYDWDKRNQNWLARNGVYHSNGTGNLNPLEHQKTIRRVIFGKRKLTKYTEWNSIMLVQASKLLTAALKPQRHKAAQPYLHQKVHDVGRHLLNKYFNDP